MEIRDIKLTDLIYLQKHKDEFTDIHGVGAIFNICKRTVCLWTEKGILKSKKIGNTHYYKIFDIIEMFK